MKSSRLLTGETEAEAGHEDPLEGEVVVELGRRQVFLVVNGEGSRLDPGPTGRVLAPHQPLGAAPVPEGARTEAPQLSEAGASSGSVQPQVRVGRRPLVSHVVDGVLHGGQVAAGRDAHGLDDLLSAGGEERGEENADLQQTHTNSEVTAEAGGLWKLPRGSPGQPQATTKNPFLEAGGSSSRKTPSMVRPRLEAQPTRVAILRFPGTGWFRVLFCVVQDCQRKTRAGIGVPLTRDGNTCIKRTALFPPALGVVQTQLAGSGLLCGTY